MLSYQHIYHAGNFADVQKHAVLGLLLKTLCAKTPRLTVLDTHAGRGIYDLAGAEAQKNGEFENGALPLWKKKALPPEYAAVVENLNPDGALRFYPGSAAIARALLRPADKLICYERHPGEFRALQKALEGKTNTVLNQGDGFQALVDLSPLPGKKGLVVVDPSYEMKTEYADLARQLALAWKKWRQGIFMIWYPVLPAGQHMTLLNGIYKAGIGDVLVSEIRFDKPPGQSFHMYGTGIAVINPPWPVGVLDALTQRIAGQLTPAAAGRSYFLENEKIDPETGNLLG
jgi:23S rRNA (adenine2030-N6)-methyltransferase